MTHAHTHSLTQRERGREREVMPQKKFSRGAVEQWSVEEVSNWLTSVREAPFSIQSL